MNSRTYFDIKDKRKELKKKPTYDRTFLVTRSFSNSLIASEYESIKYREDAIETFLNEKGYTEEEKKEAKEKLFMENDSDVISSISRNIKGDTIDRLLNFLPEALYWENIISGNSTGLGIIQNKKDDLHYPLFLEVNEKSLEELKNKNIKYKAVIICDSNEWAKQIFCTDKPQRIQKKRLTDTLKKLEEYKVFHSVGDGLFEVMPLVEVRYLVDAKNRSKTYRLTLNPILTLAIKNGIPQEDFVKCMPLKEKIKYSNSNKVYWHLIGYLENLYSYASGDIKRGKTLHQEKVENIYNRLISKKNYQNNNYSKIKNDILIAFKSMENLGIIKKGTFRKDRNLFIWEWNKDYFNNAKENE